MWKIVIKTCLLICIIILVGYLLNSYVPELINSNDDKKVFIGIVVLMPLSIAVIAISFCKYVESVLKTF